MSAATRATSAGVRARPRHHAGDAGHALGDVRDGGGGAAHVGDEARGRGALLIHRGGDRIGDQRQLVDRFRDRADRGDRLAGGRLDLGDLGADLAGRLAGLRRERLHFGRHHRKAAPGLARARRLDGGVERKQVGLFGDCRDDADDLADVLRGLRQRADGLAGIRRALDRAAADVGALAHLVGDRIDGGDHLVGKARRILVERARVVGGLRGLGRGDMHRLERTAHVGGLGAQHRRAVGDGAQAALGRGLDLARHVRQVGAARRAFGAGELVMFRAVVGTLCGGRDQRAGDRGQVGSFRRRAVSVRADALRPAPRWRRSSGGPATTMDRARIERKRNRERRNAEAEGGPKRCGAPRRRAECLARKQRKRRQQRHDEQPFGNSQVPHGFPTGRTLAAPRAACASTRRKP